MYDKSYASRDVTYVQVMEFNFDSIRQYNFWDGVPDLGYFRDEYLSEILECGESNLVRVLVGQRRTGKSYILRQLAKTIISNGVNPANVLMVNLEFSEFAMIDTWERLNEVIQEYRSIMKPQGKMYCFFDEIQNVKGWERLINSMSQNFINPAQIYITGSNSRLLSSELATLLSGRYISYEILPFSFHEYCGYNGVDEGRAAYMKYMGSGGLPELFHIASEQSRKNYVGSLIDTILLRDIVERYSIKDIPLLRTLLRYLTCTASSLVSLTNIRNYLSNAGSAATYETVTSYIGHIEASFVIHGVEKYDIGGKRMLTKIAKYYSNDPAYYNYAFSSVHYGLGYMLENIVYLELRRKGYEVGVGAKEDREIDFVATKGDRMIYIQVAYSIADEQTAMREYGAFSIVRDNHEKIVVTLDDYEFPRREGIRHVCAWRLRDIL